MQLHRALVRGLRTALLGDRLTALSVPEANWERSLSVGAHEIGADAAHPAPSIDAQSVCSADPGAGFINPDRKGPELAIARMGWHAAEVLRIERIGW